MIFPSSPSNGDTHTEGLTYTFNSGTNSWDIIDDLLPIHHWRLNEPSGTAVNDAGSSPVSGLITGTVALNSAGIIDKCITFTHTASGRIDCGLASIPITGPHSETLWVYFTNASGDGNNFLLAQHTSLTADRWTLYQDDQGEIKFFNEGGPAFELSSTSPVATWTHLALTYDGTTCKGYVNGIETATTDTDVAAQNTRTTVGGVVDEDGRTFNGKIEDVRIYDRALTQQEINTIYNEGKGTYSQSFLRGYPTRKPPIHHWKLQEADGTFVSDAGSSPSSGLITGGVTVNSAGIIGNSMLFDGVSGYIVADNNNISIASGSLFCWIKSTDINTTLIDSRSVSTSNGFGLFMITTGLLHARVNNTTINGNAVNDDKWHNVGCVWDGVNLKLYTDGEYVTQVAKVATATLTNTWCLGTTNVVTPSLGSYIFTGNMEDARIYDYGLSADEVANIYNGGRGLLI